MQRESHQLLLDLERVRALYANGRFSIAGVLISAGFFILFTWENLDRSLLLGWFTLILTINLPRLVLVERFHSHLRRGEINTDNASRWERHFYIGLIFSALSWSLVSIFPYNAELLQSLSFTALLLIGMSSASIVTLITSLKMGLTFLTATMLPLIARSIWTGAEPFLLLALAGLTYYVIFTNMACRLHNTVIDNISLRLENEELSLKDVLTGLWNRRQLELFTEQHRHRLEQDDHLSLIMMDLDKFKDFNDGQGHPAGDSLLSKVAGIIAAESRGEDLVVRYGGEEFLVVLPGTDIEQAAMVAERIRQGVKRQTAISISAGVAACGEDETLEQATTRADRALYRAKAEGRDRVVVASELEMAEV